MANIPEVNLETTNKMNMLHLRFTTLLLGLVLSLLAVVVAHKEVAMTNNRQALGSVNELGNEAKMVTATKSGRLIGRNIGMDDAPKKEDRNEMINTGKDRNSPSKSYGTPNMEDSCVLSNSQAIGTQKLIEATAEIFKMMNKDYRQKVRRQPPMNNNRPLDDKNKNMTP